MKTWNIQQLLPLLRECGKIALEYYEDPPVEIKEDQSIVTAADKAVEKRLAAEFDRPEDGVYLIGEETVAARSESYLQKALSETAWIVDPIDGTAPYSVHMPAWAISIALMKNGTITDGAIYLPAQNKCLLTDGNRVLHCPDVAGGAVLEEFKFVPHQLAPDGIIGCSQENIKNNTFKMSNQVFSWGGCVASFYFLFTGRLMAYIASVKLWDIAACLALLERSPFIISDKDGKILSAQVDNNTYVLDAGKQRWQLRKYAIAAGNSKIIDFILENSNLLKA